MAGQKENKIVRTAGVLCHISSLPSAFGIGDFGPEAIRFAKFLKSSNQSWWQILPLTPIDVNQAFSPYSSVSAMAGNTALISPELLVADGLLQGRELNKFRTSPDKPVNYKELIDHKNQLLGIAYQRFIDKKEFAGLNRFRQKEKFWLRDFALFMAIRQEQNGKAWFEWPEELKKRDPSALKDFANAHKDEIRRFEWEQYIFSLQWEQLRKACREMNLRFIGDLPFYVSYDSADVWSNQEIFNLDKNGKMLTVAGVPPDYFNAEGQLWGMPIFNWERLKERGYDWWINRIKKNIELYDLLRLDHFRAFADFWEVNAKAATARRGKWKPGPGTDFFDAIQKSFPEMPFIAEDLGKIGRNVYDLRDAYQMPGMVVLQFAFGNDIGNSVHINHHHRENTIAYTGTHDNNTTLGWFRNDLDQNGKANLNKYLGKTVRASEVHDDLIRLAYSSVAKTVIIPVQDLLGLDKKARMNTPATIAGNWTWRLTKNQIRKELAARLKDLTEFYGRNPKPGR